MEGARRVEGTKMDLMRTANDAMWMGVAVECWMVLESKAVRGVKVVYMVAYHSPPQEPARDP